MTLLQVIRTIEQVVADQPAIRTIVRNDVYRLNACPSVNYGVFAWLQNQHSSVLIEGLRHYSFTFFYVDRLTADKANELEIQSVGMEVLENILRVLYEKGVFCTGEATFRAFTERFHDECAGVFCNVRLEVAKDTICEDEYNITQQREIQII